MHVKKVTTTKGGSMKRYEVHIIVDFAEYPAGEIWASNPRNALSMAATKRYGANGFKLVKDDTVYGLHATNNENTESMEVH